ncbi:MAG: hypothetical protein E6H49_04435 [Betaproteobacteria bacterium]|nr:MAG: hypothetical protein E6H56_09445 [Betaproteobacteria bacterium]TMH82513.1 MAG: hypothetical protein E6H49_04435 [Betaproteobacteria bacterium]
MNSVLVDVFAFVGAGWVRPIILAALLGGLWVGLQRAGLDRRERLVTWFGVTVPLLAWLFAVLQLAESGVFRPGAVAPLPALPLAVVLPILVALPLLVGSKNIAAAIDAVPPSWLIGLQVYRVLGAVFLVRWATGTLPGAFALPAGAGDTLVGLLALPVAFFVHSRARGSRAAGYAWNVLGILDLALALAMGFLTTPGPFQMFALDRPNTGIGTYPLVMIPAFAVPLSLILHGLSLWQLRRTARRSAVTSAFASPVAPASPAG